MEMGLSQEKLADLAEVHRTYVGQIERAEKNVSIDSLQPAFEGELWGRTE